MKKYFYFLISIVCYLIGTGGLFYFLAWLGDLAPFSELNHAPTMSAGAALAKNMGLMLLFGMQHTLMARKSFKKRWQTVIPQPIERSVYVLFSGLLCLLIAWQWAPLQGWVWHLEPGSVGSIILMSVYALGIVFLLASSFLINHFELFGLQQSFLYLKNRKAAPPRFTDFAFYRMTRHPIYLGLLLIVWSTPDMSVTRLVLAVSMTVYIYIGIFFEEKDLVEQYGDEYRMYRRRVSKLIPGITSRTAGKPVYQKQI